MCAQRDHEVKLFCVIQNIDKQTEQERQGQGARMIGNQDQQALTMKCAIQSSVQRFDDLVL
jgi:hypothetical protein